MSDLDMELAVIMVWCFCVGGLGLIIWGVMWVIFKVCDRHTEKGK